MVAMTKITRTIKLKFFVLLNIIMPMLL